MIFCDNEFQGKTSSDIEKMKRDKIENIFKENNKRKIKNKKNVERI